MKYISLFFALFLSSICLQAQENSNNNPFRQLGAELPTPNTYRTASGAPGHEYWQTRADYEMDIRIDDDNQRIYGEETITYHNLSPDDMRYLWLQLDQNVRAKDSDSHHIRQDNVSERMDVAGLVRMEAEFDGGFKIDHVKNGSGTDLNYTINKTMLRIDLEQTLKAGESYSFNIKWWYNINDRMKIGGRSGYEHFEENDNYLYTIAQFFPRMCSYNDIEGWQNKQFLGRGEFTLIFGDYDVKITAPADHLVASTGELINAKDILSKTQLNRWDEATTSYEEPVIIVTQNEAEKAEKGKVKNEKTWHYKAENVRDFAFASSRKFIWDAMAVKFGDRTVMAMSMYPKEGNPLWEQFSTKAVAHTLKWYSHYTFDYPYPVAWSIHAARIGMEYPMICFNFGRPEEDGTYSARTKYGMIGVIIHEVGHNYFPMIVNSDERQWTWMDEGLNSFLEYLTAQQWERDYPSRRGPAPNITGYMGGDKSKISPIMTNSESIYQFGNNAYGKPATALNILRETVMGREVFDHAFKEYSRRWMFKQPYPADFFRSMEDASAVDLDWFWRGWFYTNDHSDFSIASVESMQYNPKDPAQLSSMKKKERDESLKNISSIRNREEIEKTQDEIDPSIRDFYTDYDELEYDAIDQENYDKFLESLSDEEKAKLGENKYYHKIEIKKEGGLVMPVILKLVYTDGTDEVIRIPAEIWKMDNQTATKVYPRSKDLKEVILDPFLETADINMDDNFFPRRESTDRFDVIKRQSRNGGENPMQRQKRAAKKS